MNGLASSCCARVRKAIERAPRPQDIANLAITTGASGVRQHPSKAFHLRPTRLRSERSLSENRSWRLQPLYAPSISSPKHPFSFTTATSLGVPAQARIGARRSYSSETQKIDEEDDELDQDWLKVFQGMHPLRPDLTSIGGIPPLPPIVSDALRTQVFTHRSVAARSRHDFEVGLGEQALDNEVLEFQGDAVLGLIVADLIREAYPRLKVGPSTKIRSLVVSNATLADISLKYDLPAKMRFQRAQSLTLKASPGIQADTFESYVGGLYVEQGLNTVRKWAKKLFVPYIDEAYRICREQHVSPPPSPTLLEEIAGTSISSSPSEENESTNDQASSSSSQCGVGHLSFLNQYLTKHRISYEWKYASIHEGGNGMTPTWHAKLKIDDKILATGKGTTKKVAQNEASREALRELGVSVP